MIALRVFSLPGPNSGANARDVLVSYVVSQAANVEVSVRHRGREVVRTGQSAAPGKNVLPLGRRLPDGQNVITLTATVGGARATDRMAMLPNGFLPRRAATAVIRTGEDESREPAGTPVGNAAGRPRAADTYSVVYIVGCRRFSRSRVDCVRHETDTPPTATTFGPASRSGSATTDGCTCGPTPTLARATAILASTAARVG